MRSCARWKQADDRERDLLRRPGPGLPAGFLKTIGERFNILRPVLNRGGEVQGLGLGLSLAKRVSDLLGGRLEFSANTPSGTIATLTLTGPGVDADQVRSG